jgi:carbon storage regulator
MLVLTRKKNEKMYIGDDIVINVVRINGNSVRIGIEAPQYLPIYREEVRCKGKAGEKLPC